MIFAWVATAGVCFAQNSALDAPGEKKITVGSEIKRGYEEVFHANLDAHSESLLEQEVALNDVITRNRAAKSDSDGFLLGARFQQWREMEMRIPIWRQHGTASHQEVVEAFDANIRHFQEFRALQKQLGVDDDALLTALNFDTQESRDEVKRLIADYERPKNQAQSSSPTAAPIVAISPVSARAPTPPSEPSVSAEYVTLLRDVQVPRGASTQTLPKGSKLIVVGRGSGIVQVRVGSDSEIVPADAVMTESK